MDAKGKQVLFGRNHSEKAGVGPTVPVGHTVSTFHEPHWDKASEAGKQTSRRLAAAVAKLINRT